jgi:hypothetical protein
MRQVIVNIFFFSPKRMPIVDLLWLTCTYIYCTCIANMCIDVVLLPNSGFVIETVSLGAPYAVSAVQFQ